MLLEKTSRLRGNSTVFTLFAIIAVGVTTLGWYGYNLVQASIDPDIVYNFQFSEAEVGLFKHTINETGDIEAAENVEVKCEVRSSGGVEIISVVDEGEVVSKGDLLVELDTSTLEDQKQAQNIIVNRATHHFLPNTLPNASYAKPRLPCGAEAVIRKQRARQACAQPVRRRRADAIIATGSRGRT